jgi:activator of Hsp90 ATPase-like protein
MGDYHIRMQFDIDAERKTVHEALTTRDGVAAWWSDRVEGNPGEAGTSYRIAFPDVEQPFAFDVVTSTDERVEWRTADFPPWWQGTTIRWDLADVPDASGTRLLFSHRDFDPDNEVIPIVTPAWAQIVLHLKSYAETGRPTPFFRLSHTT